MKTLFTTIFFLLFICSSFAQIGNKTLGNNKLSSKNLGTSISIKPSRLTLKDVALPKNFDINKASRLEVPAEKLKLPSRKKMKITPINPYNPNLDLEVMGAYCKRYFLSQDGAIVNFNAQKGKEYRIKVLLSPKSDFPDFYPDDFPNGDVIIWFGNDRTEYSIPVTQTKREFSLIFNAVQAGSIQIILYGIVPHGMEWRNNAQIPAWMPIKAIEVDEI